MAWYNFWKKPKKDYDALNPKITDDGWNPHPSTPTQDLWSILGLSARVDWLLKNDPMAERIINTYKSYVIGGEGINFQAISKSNNGDLVRTVEAANVAFFDSTECDAQSTQTLSGIQGTAMREIAKQGGVFLRRRNRPFSMGLTVPFQIQLLTYDYLAQDYSDSNKSNPIIQGIEYNARWQPVAYYFYKNNPRENYTYYQGTTSDSASVIRVQAKDICHLYKKDHGDQKLGVSWLAPIIPTLKMMANYRLNVLTKQQIQSGMTAMVYTDDIADPNGLVGTKNTDNTGTVIKRGQINRLNPGESIEFPTMPDISGDSEFYNQYIRLAAIGSGLSFEAISANVSEVNFSSARMGWTDMYRNITDWQENIFVAQMMNKLDGWFREGLLLQGIINRPQNDDLILKSIKPRRIMLDPVRETNALVAQINANYKSLPEAIEEDGRDYIKVMKQIQYDMQTRQDLGIINPESNEIEDEGEDD